MITNSKVEQTCTLHSPTALPKASGFLWNDKMMLHVNCRGYVVAQFMQPEPAKYSHAPNLEAKTFMQPEQPYYAHHPGRFVYIKDEENGQIFSAPYEPTRVDLDEYRFKVGQGEISWQVIKDEIKVDLSLSLSPDSVAELWSLQVTNLSNRQRKISVYPYFTIGYMSWMNQSAEYNDELGAIVASSITPYQKYQDYAKIKHLWDKTYLIAETKPDYYDCNQEQFEGEGGLTYPDGINSESLACLDARYEMPAAVMQYRLTLEANTHVAYRFVFGAAFDEAHIKEIKAKYFDKQDFEPAKQRYLHYVAEGAGLLHIETPDEQLNHFVNNWLARQVYYHGITNRLSTDPQTRNLLQDHMGMTYIKSDIAKKHFLIALAQQRRNGSMPDGIILHPDAELKYINQVPHTDHCVWLPICIEAYLDETNDYAFLDEKVGFHDSEELLTVSEHLDLAVNWLLHDRDERGLNYINQGDWCDPMNMVGYKGKGVSGWLTIATAYACKVWAKLSDAHGRKEQSEYYTQKAAELNSIVNRYLWDGQWYARGITDDNVVFGVSSDKEGKIFINPQGWSLLSGAPSEEQKEAVLKSVDTYLETPYGLEKLYPPFTKMREDVGRVTQKFPGNSENGAVYNHAVAFYIYALYEIGEYERAFRLVKKMLPGANEEDLLQRGQLPVFIPNYYRGAYELYPRTAGRSSHLFNTGTSAWYYRILIDGLFGLRGHSDGLYIAPQLPSTWTHAKAIRKFRGATFNVEFVRSKDYKSQAIEVDGEAIDGACITTIEPGKTYSVKVWLPLV